MYENKFERFMDYFWVFYGEIYQLWVVLMFTHIGYILLRDLLSEAIFN